MQKTALLLVIIVSKTAITPGCTTHGKQAGNKVYTFIKVFKLLFEAVISLCSISLKVKLRLLLFQFVYSWLR